ncbi:uncharacterized protein phf11 isoform X3 [Neoarius graeffei]|uniref:uncharacterized protein phf11 isoform X3 n=1 Tax=Neoarius graeffei TaxID=443677 RepID=UPI00298D190F|nr:uncharacterized protein phf11 isoform X3 [Neoarius graeffei]
MRPEERGSPSLDKRCILCKRTEETKTTGPLSCKQGIAAHQDCLLYASGIYCKNSPAFDDLFGFDVEDVEDEYKRGRKLKCYKCGLNGATAGCEVKSCRRSYHYPCAIEAHAKSVEDRQIGIFKLYCEKHNPHASSAEEGDAKVVSSTSGCKRSEMSQQDNSCRGSESDSETPTRRSLNRKRKYMDIYSSDSDETQSVIDPNLGPIESDQEDNTPPIDNMLCHNSETAVIECFDDGRDNKEPRQGVALASSGGCGDGGGEDEASRDSDSESQSLLLTEYCQENVPITVIADSGPSTESIAENSPDPCSPVAPSPADPALSNLDQSVSAPEQVVALHSNITILPNPPVPACPSLDSLPSDANGESSSVKEASCGDPSLKLERCASRNQPPVQMTDELPGCHVKHPCDNPLDLTAPEGCLMAHVQGGKPVDQVAVSNSSAALFWRRCNEVGCTQAIFTELTRQLTNLAERVQNQHATQQDYAVSLRILEASGKLPAIFRQMEQDFEDQEIQLQRKKEALRDAKAVLDQNQFS